MDSFIGRAFVARAQRYVTSRTFIREFSLVKSRGMLQWQRTWHILRTNIYICPVYHTSFQSSTRTVQDHKWIYDCLPKKMSMNLWYSFHKAMYFNILFSGCCLYIYIYTTYLCHTYRALGIIMALFFRYTRIFGDSAISEEWVSWHWTMAVYAVYSMNLWHPSSRGQEKKFTNKTNWIRTKFGLKTIFFGGWQGLGCSFPGYFSQEGIGGKNPLLQKSWFTPLEPWNMKHDVSCL